MHVARMRAAGAVPIGKTAAPEFGTLNFTKTKAWGITRNPWDPTRTPGGSSGGSAAAVGRRARADRDGQRRRRVDPHPGRLHRPGRPEGRLRAHPASGPSGSQTAVYGVLTTTVADAARHLDVVAGPDDRDRTSLPAPGVSYERAIEDARRRPASGPAGRSTSGSPPSTPRSRS